MPDGRPKRPRTSPSYAKLKPASKRASAAARGSSTKRDTKCELLLRRALWRMGFRYRVDVASLPGRPDIVLTKQRVAVFCDGDFWHGRDLEKRLQKLDAGHNSAYWVEKIRGNVARDRRHEAALAAQGWTVVRIWETDIRRSPERAALEVAHACER